MTPWRVEHRRFRRTVGLWAGAGVVLLAVARPLQGQVPAAPRTGRVTGTVMDTTGAPIAGATVRVMPAREPYAVTDDSGRFTLQRVPVGRVQLAVRRLGYAPDSTMVDVAATAGPAVRVRLQASAFVLEAVSVTDSVTSPWMRTFEARRQSERGYFFTRSDIMRSQVEVTTDLMRRVPGVLIESGRWGPAVLFTHGGIGAVPCRPQLYVHHMAYSGDLNDFSPDDIEGLEVYNGISTVPIEFQSARARSCGAIVIWTRDPTVRR